MVFARITGAITIIFGIFIGLTHFNIISNYYFGLDLVMIGILLFIIHEAFALFMNMKSEGNKTISIGVPSLFIIVAASYFVRAFLPGAIASNITLIIPVLMIAEGLYRLH